MTLTNRTVFVTGATGFIGGRLVEKLVLEERANVRVLVRNFSTAARLARFPVEFVAGDMRDTSVVQKATEGCDVVFHCAHQKGVKRGRQKQVAVEGTRSVAKAALGSGVRRIVHLSSYAVYGPTLDGDLTEASPWRRTGHRYIQAKRATEKLMLELHRREDLAVVVLQPTIVYGPFCKPWTDLPAEDLKTSRVALVNGGTGYCNAVYIDDVVQAMILAATQPGVVGETFLISADEPVSWRRLWGAFEEALGIHSTVEVTKDEFQAIVRRQSRRNGAASQLLRLARDPRAVSRLRSMFPAVASFVSMLEKLVPGQHLQSQTSRHSANGGAPGENWLDEKPVSVPRQALPEFYLSRTRVRIDKARELLGYVSRFDFEHGMDLTARYLHWANLA